MFGQAVFLVVDGWAKMHQVHRGPSNRVCEEGRFPKLTDLEVGFSRDGFHWHRPSREPFLAGTRREGDWDRAYLHSTTGVFVVLGEKLVRNEQPLTGDCPLQLPLPAL